MKCTVSALWRRVPCYYLKPFSNHRQLGKDLSGRERWGLGGHFITSQQRVCFASLQAVWRCEGEDRCYKQTWRRKDLSASADWFTTPGWKPAPQCVPLSGMLRHCACLLCSEGSRGHLDLLAGMWMFFFSPLKVFSVRVPEDFPAESAFEHTDGARRSHSPAGPAAAGVCSLIRLNETQASKQRKYVMLSCELNKRRMKAEHDGNDVILFYRVRKLCMCFNNFW